MNHRRLKPGPAFNSVSSAGPAGRPRQYVESKYYPGCTLHPGPEPIPWRPRKMQTLSPNNKADTLPGPKAMTWRAPRLRVESIAAITQGGLQTGLDQCVVGDGGQCD